MSKGLENLTNIVPPSTNYPYGNIRDNNGSGNGTPLDQISHADYHQTFRKWLEMAGITPNNLPDNVANGFQYVQALEYLYRRVKGTLNFPTNSTTTLGVSDVRSLIYVNGNTSTKSFNLPNGANLKDGDSFIFFNYTNQICIVQSGTDFVLGGSDVTLPAQFDFVELIYDKPNTNWIPANVRITPNTLSLPIVTPTLGSGWTQGQPVRVRRDSNGMVFLEGILSRTTSYVSPLFNIPSAYRPFTSGKSFNVTTNDGTAGNLVPNILVIDTAGNATLVNTPSYSVGLNVYLGTVAYYQ